MCCKGLPGSTGAPPRRVQSMGVPGLPGLGGSSCRLKL